MDLREESRIEIYAKNPEDIPHAYSQYYCRLADMFNRLITPLKPRVLLEAGCGRGQLTVPLIERLPRNIRLIGIDSSQGPYRGWLEHLEDKVKEAGLEKRVHLVRSDARRMRRIRSQSVDVLISNELICDITEHSQLQKALREFHRVLRPGGTMIHGEWCSSHDEKLQDLTVVHSPAWNPDELSTLLARAGFHDVNVFFFNTTIKFGPRAARTELQTWGATPSRVRKQILPDKRFMRLPSEHILVSRK